MSGMFGSKKRSIGKMGEKLPEQHDGLPDSSVPHGLCLRCQKQSSFQVAGPQAVTFNPEIIRAERSGRSMPMEVDQVSVLYCRNCNQGIVVVEEQLVNGHSWREGS